MDFFVGIDWRELFTPTLPLLEILVRGTVVYLALFLMLRFILKREVGAVSITDMLVIVLIADAAQMAMSGGYESITDGLLLVGVIIGWNYLLDFIASRSEVMRRFLRPPPLLLVDRGRMLSRNMRREFITEDELNSKLRMAGIEDVEEVEKAYMEGDGEISIIPRDKKVTQAQDRQQDLFR